MQGLPSLLFSIGGNPQKPYSVVQWFRLVVLVVVLMARGGLIGICRFGSLSIKVYRSSVSPALGFLLFAPAPNDIFENGRHCFRKLFWTSKIPSVSILSTKRSPTCRSVTLKYISCAFPRKSVALVPEISFGSNQFFGQETDCLCYVVVVLVVGCN